MEDSEPYPCLPWSVPEPGMMDYVDPAGRDKRSIYLGESDQTNDVYNIFKVDHR